MATLTSLQVAAGFSPRLQEKGLFTISGEYTLTATLASADIVQMVKIPDGVTVLGIEYTIPTLDGGSINTPMLFNVGDGADTNRFVESESANIARKIVAGTTDTGSPLTTLPFTYDLSDNDPDGFDTIDMEVIAFSGTGTLAGTIKLTAFCTADYP